MQKLKDEIFIQIIEEIKSNPKVTEEYLAKKMFYSERTIRRYFKILKDNKKIVLINSGKNRRWKILE